MKNLSMKFALTALVLITLALASALFFPMLQDYKFEKKIDALSAQESALYNKLRYEHPLISKEKLVEAVKLPKFFRDTFIQNKIAELKGQGRQANVKVAAEKATQRIVPSAAISSPKTTETYGNDELIDLAKQNVIDMLIDPDSAKFSGVYHIDSPLKGSTVCGFINAKNRFGGMTGKKPFYYLVGENEAGIITKTDEIAQIEHKYNYELTCVIFGKSAAID